MLDVLYEDNHVIVCYKEAGILSQKDITGDIDMTELVKKYIKEKYNKPGDVYLGLIHRLDRMTSGVMVFARTSKAAQRLSDDVKNHRFIKEYLCVCEGQMPLEEKRLVNYMVHDDKTNISRICKDGKEAILTYKVIEYKENKSLVSVMLETGRHHQIRLQMSNIGHPLYGDKKYGSKYQNDLPLQAFRLSFYHPITKELMSFEKINNEGLFKDFLKV